MFEAFMLVCMISNATICHTLADTEGPYNTHDECILRIDKMARDLKSYLPNYLPVNYKCNQKGTRI